MPPLWDIRALCWVTAPQSLGHRITKTWYHPLEPHHEHSHTYHQYSLPLSRAHACVKKSRTTARFHNGGGTMDFIKMKSLSAEAQRNHLRQV